MPDLNTSLNLFLIYIPSLVGLILVTWQMVVMLRLARREKSLATPFLFALTLAMTGVLVSWAVVLGIAYTVTIHQYSLLNWRISLLPLGWAIILVFINREMRR
jgi:hypothetical protein